MSLFGATIRNLTAPLIFVLLAGCGGQPADGGKYATSKIFYFEVNCPTGGPNCAEAKALLDREIPLYKYTFTPGSSRTWPYYRAFPPDAQVPPDSLISPHTQLHRLLPKSERPWIGGGEYLVTIDLYINNDTEPEYLVNVYHLEQGNAVLTGTSGPQLAVQRPGMSLSMPEILLRSVIRYSFK
ncbi:MAG: hypothetical protein JNN04_09420 [Cyclobacteriaceae bacterium]|nr:hypothetical protein [Cyclobacteriaceae bacterium]